MKRGFNNWDLFFSQNKNPVGWWTQGWIQLLDDVRVMLLSFHYSLMVTRRLPVTGGLQQLPASKRGKRPSLHYYYSFYQGGKDCLRNPPRDSLSCATGQYPNCKGGCGSLDLISHTDARREEWTLEIVWLRTFLLMHTKGPEVHRWVCILHTFGLGGGGNALSVCQLCCSPKSCVEPLSLLLHNNWVLLPFFHTYTLVRITSTL